MMILFSTLKVHVPKNVSKLHSNKILFTFFYMTYIYCHITVHIRPWFASTKVEEAVGQHVTHYSQLVQHKFCSPLDRHGTRSLQGRHEIHPQPN